jgi:hypothetical protein
VNEDALTDLLGHYRTPASGIAAGHTTACLRWHMRDGTPYESCDTIATPPPANCGAGFDLALALPPLFLLRHRRATRGGRRGSAGSANV